MNSRRDRGDLVARPRRCRNHASGFNVDGWAAENVAAMAMPPASDVLRPCMDQVVQLVPGSGASSTRSSSESSGAVLVAAALNIHRESQGTSTYELMKRRASKGRPPAAIACPAASFSPLLPAPHTRPKGTRTSSARSSTATARVRRRRPNPWVHPGAKSLHTVAVVSRAVVTQSRRGKRSTPGNERRARSVGGKRSPLPYRRPSVPDAANVPMEGPTKRRTIEPRQVSGASELREASVYGDGVRLRSSVISI